MSADVLGSALERDYHKICVEYQNNACSSDQCQKSHSKAHCILFQLGACTNPNCSFLHEQLSASNDFPALFEEEGEFDLFRGLSRASYVSESNEDGACKDHKKPNYRESRKEFNIRSVYRVVLGEGGNPETILRRGEYIRLRCHLKNNVSIKETLKTHCPSTSFAFIDPNTQTIFFEKAQDAATCYQSLLSNKIPVRICQELEKEEETHLHRADNYAGLEIEVQIHTGQLKAYGELKYPSREQAYRACMKLKGKKVGFHGQPATFEFHYSDTLTMRNIHPYANSTLIEYTIKQVTPELISSHVSVSEPDTADHWESYGQSYFYVDGRQMVDFQKPKEGFRVFTWRMDKLSGFHSLLKFNNVRNWPFSHTYTSAQFVNRYTFEGEKYAVLKNYLHETVKNFPENIKQSYDITKTPNSLTISLKPQLHLTQGTERMSQEKIFLDKLFHPKAMEIDEFTSILTAEMKQEIITKAQNSAIFLEFQHEKHNRIFMSGSEYTIEKFRHEIWSTLYKCKVVEVAFERNFVKLIPKTQLKNVFGVKFRYNSLAGHLILDGDDHEKVATCGNLLRCMASQIEVNKAFIAKDYQQGDICCGVCWCDIDADADFVALKNCHHLVHRECMQMQVEEVAQGTVPLPVICATCATPAHLADIRVHLDQDGLDSLVRKSYRTYVDNHFATMRWCPSTDCLGVINVFKEGSSMDDFDICRCCNISFCTKCFAKEHTGVTCEEVAAAKEGTLEDKQFGNFIDKWRDEQAVKLCPNCKQKVEKMDGCDRMECHYCHIQFCWNCVTYMADNQDDVYTHMYSEDKCEELTGFEEPIDLVRGLFINMDMPPSKKEVRENQRAAAAELLERFEQDMTFTPFVDNYEEFFYEPPTPTCSKFYSHDDEYGLVDLFMEREDLEENLADAFLELPGGEIEEVD